MIKIKILVALNNDKIFKLVKKEFNKESNEVYRYDIDTKENVIEFLSKNRDEYTVLTREDLAGSVDNKLFVKQMRAANPNITIIYFVNSLNREYKEFLFANEVFNIFEGGDIDINKVLLSIKEDKKVVYEKSNINEAAQKYEYNPNVSVIKKEIIAIYGTSGSGKSIISSLLAKRISKDFNIKVALLDMDIEDPSIDIINNIDEKDVSLSQIVESVDNQNEINNIIEKYMIKDAKNKNLWYITNNCSLFECQNKLSNKYYEKIYSSLYKKCDYTIIDLPSSPFLDVVPYTLNIATKIFFVINANYMSIRQAIKYINLITKLWDNDNGKIYLIVNKMQRDSLEIKQIESLLSGYKIVSVLDYSKDIEGYINGGIYDLNVDFNLSKLYEKLGLVAKPIKESIIKRIYKKYK